MEQDFAGRSTTELATELTIAWLGNPSSRVSADDVPAFLLKMHQTVAALGAPVSEDANSAHQEHTPAVSVRKSLSSSDYILSMIDGKPYKTLRRHLTTHGLTPDEYRTRYGLKGDYPMVAPTYSATRRDMAKRIGLGRKSDGADVAESTAATTLAGEPGGAPSEA